MIKPEKMLISSDGHELVPKMPGLPRPKPQRFYNWPKDLEDGQPPKATPFERLEVPCDDWHISLALSGNVDVVGPEEAVRLVDSMRRDKRIALEHRIGWDSRKPERAAKKTKTDTPAPKPEKESDQ